MLFNLAQYLLTVSVFLPAMMIWYRVPLAAPMLLFPVFLALQVVFTIGVALILATATAFFRDVRHLLEVALAMLFWTTPIVYELRQVPERFRLLILLSPMSSFVVAYQQMFFYREWPDATVWLVAVRSRARRASWSARCSSSRSKTASRSSCSAGHRSARRSRSGFCCGTTPSVELKVRFLGLFHHEQRQSIEEFWALKRCVARASITAKRSGWSGATDRARARC